METPQQQSGAERGGVPTPAELDEPVVAYTTRWCGYCHLALKLLRKKGITFREIGVDGNAAARQWLMQTTGRHTVPQIFVHGRSIGGYTDLSALDSSGELARMLAAR
jgi:glutaredoxin 3